MATLRNYGDRAPSHARILRCEESVAVEKPDERVMWNPEYAGKEDEVPRRRCREKAKDSATRRELVSRELRWLIESDPEAGAQELSNVHGKRVLLEFAGKYGEKLPKNALERYIHSGAGPYERKRLNRRAEPVRVFRPQLGEEHPTRRIDLLLEPPKGHFLHTAERTRGNVHDYCPGCMTAGASTAATVGAGKKSARKTKGRKKRERLQLRVAGLNV